MRTDVVAAGILIEHGKVLLSRRKSGTHLAGLWEFPGGKADPGEDPRAALRRELDACRSEAAEAQAAALEASRTAETAVAESVVAFEPPSVFAMVSGAPSSGPVKVMTFVAEDPERVWRELVVPWIGNADGQGTTSSS